jgi:phosphomannomutase
MDQAVFKAYDIRGIYPDQIDEQDAWKIGYAAGRFLPSLLRGVEKGQANTRSICVGRDMRTHSPAMAIDIGMIDTPQIYFAINHLGTCGGIQVTASHNPAKYNGFKVSGLEAKPVGVDTGLKEIQHIATSLVHTKARATGKVTKKDLTKQYKQHVLKFLKPNVKKLKIAVDASNGMAGKSLPEVFGDLPIEIIQINFEHEGKFKHEPNPLVEANLKELKRTLKKRKCHFGICFDGDADRMQVIDEKGQTIGCDLLTALMAGYFLKKAPGSTIVYDLRSSRIVVEQTLENGGTPRRERVGHAFMKKALRDSHAVFGGELSGHFYYKDNYYADSAMITFAHLLNIASESDKPMSELIQPLRKYHSSGEINYEVEDKKAAMDEFARIYSAGDVDHLDGVTIMFKDWWFNCRPSNTEPLLRLNVEAKTAELLETRLAEIEEKLGKPV